MRLTIVPLLALPMLAGGLGSSPEDVSIEGISTAPPGPATGPSELVRLPAGTRFEAGRPPTGWSHLVLKSTPELTAGALDTLSKEAFETARRIRLMIAADVVKAGPSGPFRLRQVGVGLAAPIVDGKAEGDVIVTATHVGDHSGDWSAKDRIILAAGSRELNQASLAASTTNFALVRTPTTCLSDGEHATVDVLYAILVDPDTGRVRLLACKAGTPGAKPEVRELDAPALVSSPLHVKARTFAGLAVSWSFAMMSLPPGQERQVTPDLARMLEPGRLATADPLAMEGAFRAIAGRPVARSDRGAAQGD